MWAQKDASARSPLGTISVILATSGRTSSQPSGMMSLTRPSKDGSYPDPKRSQTIVRPTLSFSGEDKIGTLQPHDATLMVTLRIGGYDM